MSLPPKTNETAMRSGATISRHSMLHQAVQASIMAPSPSRSADITSSLRPLLVSSSGHHSSGLCDRVQFDPAKSHRAFICYTLNNQSTAPRARLGPTQVSNHVGHHVHQRRGHFPGLHPLLAASATRSFPQAASWILLLHGLVTPFCNTNYMTNLYLLWHRRWNLFLRSHRTANLLIHLLHKSRIFGQSRLCPLPIPTGTTYPSTLSRCIPPALTMYM